MFQIVPEKILADNWIHGTNYNIEHHRRSPDCGGETGLIRVCGEEVQVDNRWTVPYSPKVLQKFHYHMNVKVCVS